MLYRGAEDGRGESGDIRVIPVAMSRQRRLSWKEQVGDAEGDAPAGQYSVSGL